MFLWQEYLVLAKELSRMGSEAASRSAISRAYYCAFHVANRHRGARKAIATREGSHASVWWALIDSGNPQWRQAGQQGKKLLGYRRQADYDDAFADLTATMRRAIGLADEILLLLGE